MTRNASMALTIILLCPWGPDRSVADEMTQLSLPSVADTFDDHFHAKTMRVDYYHSGSATEDRVALDRIVSDGPWAGSRVNLVDTLDRGFYLFEVRDVAQDQVLYSRGFCSVFGEWQTTPEAKQQWGTFHESLRFPWPKQQVQVILKRRVDGVWREIWTTSIDPTSRFVIDADVAPVGEVWTVFANGPPTEKVDLLFVGDGYAADEMKSFHESVRHLTEKLFSEEPFRSRRRDFNVVAIDVPANDSGVSQPRAGSFRRSPLSCHYNTFDSERYVLTFDNRTLRDIAAAAPYDSLVILLNSDKYGGGGIFNDQTTVAARNDFSDYIMIHEFGHHVAGLGDEYYTSNVAYETGKPIVREPWEPNVTALLDPNQLKWKDLAAPGLPLPTPWNKEAYDAESNKYQKMRNARRTAKAPEKELADLFRKQRVEIGRLLAENDFAGKVGAFEGAGYEPHGLYRPAVDCVMFSRTGVSFCPVCRRAIEQVIDMQTGHRSEPE
jgi:hypothetical protein